MFVEPQSSCLCLVYPGRTLAGSSYRPSAVNCVIQIKGQAWFCLFYIWPNLFVLIGSALALEKETWGQCGQGPVIINSTENLARRAFPLGLQTPERAAGERGEQKRGCFKGIYHYTTSQGQIQGWPSEKCVSKKVNFLKYCTYVAFLRIHILLEWYFCWELIAFYFFPLILKDKYYIPISADKSKVIYGMLFVHFKRLVMHTPGL